VIASFLIKDTYSGDPSDPLSLNLYVYCFNNPITYYDPSGHWPQWLDNIGNTIRDGTIDLIQSFWNDPEETLNTANDYVSLAAFVTGVDDTQTYQDMKYIGVRVEGGLVNATNVTKGTIKLAETTGEVGANFVAHTIVSTGEAFGIKGNQKFIQAVEEKRKEILTGGKALPKAIGQGIVDDFKTTINPSKAYDYFLNPNASLHDVAEYQMSAINTAMIAVPTAQGATAVVKYGVRAIEKATAILADRFGTQAAFAGGYGNVSWSAVDRAMASGIENTGVSFAKSLQGGSSARTFGTLKPNEINFSQRTVSGTVLQYTQDMASGIWDWSRSGPLRVMKRDGQWVSYDNRRLMAAQNAGLESVPVQFVNPAALHPELPMTWEQAFLKRFFDKRNIRIGGAIPSSGLNAQPNILPARR